MASSPMNTGNKIYSTLVKVVDGGPNNGQALDINNQLVSISGLAQDSKPNTVGQPDYIAPTQDLNNCPIPSNGNVSLKIAIAQVDVCNTIPEMYYTSTGDLFTGDEIFTDAALTIPYTSGGNYVVGPNATIYNLTGNLVGASTGSNC